MNKQLKRFIVCILVAAMVSIIAFEPLTYAQAFSDVPQETGYVQPISTEDTGYTKDTAAQPADNESSETGNAGTKDPGTDSVQSETSQNDLIPEPDPKGQSSAAEPRDASDSTDTNSDVKRHTITYLTEDEVYLTESVLHNTQASEPAAPELPVGMNSFLGWYTSDGARYYFNSLVTSDFTLHAAFSEQFLVQFLVNGVVVDSELADPGQTVTQTAYTPAAPEGRYFLYWYEAGQDENEPYDFQSGVTKNLVLIPYFSASHYVFFYSEGTPVTEQLIKHGGKIITPAAPERVGYTFLGWSLEPDNDAFFNPESPVTESFTLYAVWKPEMVEYTVVYWLEKANLRDDFDAQNSTHYSHAYTVKKQALAGSTVRSEDITSDEQHPSLNHSSFSHGSTAVISGNGTTLLNVYYTRTIYTLQFNLGESESREYYYRDPDGNLYRSSDYQYTITAKFEEDIADRWPHLTYDADHNPNLYSSDEAYKFTGWMIQEGYNSDSPTLVSRRQTLTDDLIPQGYTEYNLNGVWETDTRLYYLNYMIQTIDQEDGENFNGTIYQRDMTLSQYAQSSQTWKFKDISGFTPYYIDTKTDIEPDVIHIFFYYQRQQYQLNYDTQGGEFSWWDAGPWVYMYQQPLDEPEEPFRDGYMFTGWYQDSEFRELFDFEDAIMPARDLLLFAGWESTDHTVTFWDDADGEILSTSGVETNSFVPMPSHYEAGKGYPEKGIFLGWYWYDNSSKFVSFPFEIPVTKDIDVYAAWQTEGFELTYHGGEGSRGTVPTDLQTYALDKLALVQNADLTKDGQKFIGWQIDGTGVTYWPGNALEMYGHVDLHAKYTKPGVNYSMITFHGNGGSTDGAAQINALFERGATEIPLLAGAGFTRPGYVLTGWSGQKEATAAEYAADGCYTGPLVNDIVLYAVWKPEGNPVITITAHSAQKEYDGSALNAPGYDISNTVFSNESDAYDSIEGIRILGSITDTGTTANAVDISEIKIIKNNQDITELFEIITVDGTLEIVPRSAIIEVDSKEKYQGEADPAFTGKVKNLVSPDDLGSIIYRRSDEHKNAEHAGADIAITADYSDNDNYLITIENGKLTILTKELESENPPPQSSADTSIPPADTAIPSTGDSTHANLLMLLLMSTSILGGILIRRKKSAGNM